MLQLTLQHLTQLQIHKLHVAKLLLDDGQVAGLEGMALDANAKQQTGIRVSVKARHYILAGGSINSPALLLRSQAPDPHKRLGKRTCIHPVVLSMAHMPSPTNPFYGTPQSIASDYFQWKDGAKGPIGYKLEVPPMYPGIASGIFGTFGNTLKEDMAKLPVSNAMLALMQ